jgi:hypothetical protein
VSEQYREKFRSPELFLAELIKGSAQGRLQARDENSHLLFRATVLAVDTTGGLLQNESATGTVTHSIDGHDVETRALPGLKNPRNSVKARIITDGFDQFMLDDRARVFWPFFPEHVAVPVKPGEHVYVIFEDREFEHGLWVTKVPGQENLNFFRGQDAFKGSAQSPLFSLFSDSAGVGADRSDLSTDVAAGESQSRGGDLFKLFGDDVSRRR